MASQIPITSTDMSTQGNMTDANTSGVSWSAVFAGTTASSALSLILLILGVGLGLSSVSPWSYNSHTIGIATIVWLAFIQLSASGLGGYLAGRMRVKWVSVHTDEVYFRDTAHGLLSWALASLITATILAGTVRTILNDATDSILSTASYSASSNNTSDNTINPIDYFSDVLLRSDQTIPDPSHAALHNEVSKIFITNMANNKLTAEDRDYLARMVAKRTGIKLVEAERRVDDVFNRVITTNTNAKNIAMQTAEKARKAGVYSALWAFVALLLGAFVASLAATLGGRQRDSVRLRS